LTVTTHPAPVGNEHPFIDAFQYRIGHLGEPFPMGGGANRIMLFELGLLQFPHDIEPAIHIGGGKHEFIRCQQVCV